MSGKSALYSSTSTPVLNLSAINSPRNSNGGGGGGGGGTLFASSNAAAPVTTLLPGNAKYTRFSAPDFKRRQLLFDALRQLRLNHKEIIAARPKHSSLASGASAADTPKRSTGSAALHTNAAAADRDDSDVDGPVPRSMYGWGAGYFGQLGLKDYRKKCRLEPARIEFKEPVLQIACGGFHTALLTDNGRVFTWGDGRSGQLGNLPRKLNTLTTPTLVPALCSPNLNPAHKGVVCYIACGLLHTAAVTTNGNLYTWGSGKYGQTGVNSRLELREPLEVRELDSKLAGSKFTEVSCGDRHTCVLTASGQVASFGSGTHGQLGHANLYDYVRPKLIEAFSNERMISVVCGANFTTAVSSAGLLWIWGFGESLHPKELTNIVETPRLVPIKERVRRVACGQSHVLILTETGDVHAFGGGTMGQIGHGAKTNVRTPRLVLRGKEIQDIAAGRYHSMACTAYGIVYSWGCGESGQLAHNTLDTEFFPRVVAALLPNVIGQLACGQHHSFALASIEHAGVSQDVINWKLIEEEELKLKYSLIDDLPSGLKAKHIVAVELERVNIIRRYTENLQNERSHEQSHLKQQLSEVADHSQLFIKPDQDKMMAIPTHDRKQSLSGAMLLDYDTKRQESAPAPAGMGVSASTPALYATASPKAGAGGLAASQSAAFFPAANASAAAGQSPAAAPGSIRRPSALGGPAGRLFGSSSAAWMTPANRQSLNAPQSLTASRSSASLRPGSAAAGLMSPPQADGRPEADPSPSRGARAGASPGVAARITSRMSLTGRSQLSSSASATNVGYGPGSARSGTSSTAMVAVGPPQPTAQQLSLQTLLAQAVEGPPTLGARIDFVSKTAGALAKVAGYLHSGALDPPFQANTAHLFRMKTEYNGKKAEADRKQLLAAKLEKSASLMKPNPDDQREMEQTNAQIKALNMKLVTLQTRLVEAEENRKNYDLYILRMKEEDVHLSRQIDQLRQVVLEYNRLVSKLENMTFKVRSQRVELKHEVTRFKTDIDEFAQFANFQVSKFHELLSANKEYLEKAKQRSAAAMASRNAAKFGDSSQRSSTRGEGEEIAGGDTPQSAGPPSGEEDGNAVAAAADAWTTRCTKWESQWAEIIRILGTKADDISTAAGNPSGVAPPPAVGTTALTITAPAGAGGATADGEAASGAVIIPNTTDVINRYFYNEQVTVAMNAQIARQKELIKELELEEAKLKELRAGAESKIALSKWRDVDGAHDRVVQAATRTETHRQALEHAIRRLAHVQEALYALSATCDKRSNGASNAEQAAEPQPPIVSVSPAKSAAGAVAAPLSGSELQRRSAAVQKSASWWLETLTRKLHFILKQFGTASNATAAATAGSGNGSNGLGPPPAFILDPNLLVSRHRRPGAAISENTFGLPPDRLVITASLSLAGMPDRSARSHTTENPGDATDFEGAISFSPPSPRSKNSQGGTDSYRPEAPDSLDVSHEPSQVRPDASREPSVLRAIFSTENELRIMDARHGGSTSHLTPTHAAASASSSAATSPLATQPTATVIPAPTSLGAAATAQSAATAAAGAAKAGANASAAGFESTAEPASPEDPTAATGAGPAVSAKSRASVSTGGGRDAFSADTITGGGSPRSRSTSAAAHGSLAAALAAAEAADNAAAANEVPDKSAEDLSGQHSIEHSTDGGASTNKPVSGGGSTPRKDEEGVWR